MKVAVAVAIVVLALAGAVARPTTAAAATPCWKALLNDWYDGRIDNTYPIHCYQDALRHLPADVQTYSSAHDDILRALQNARARLERSGKTVTPNTPVPPTSGPTPTKGTGKGGKQSTTTAPSTTSPGRTPPSGLPGVADKANNSGPTSVPLPLIVLGALALLLVAAGAGGLLLKRRQRP
ncbi:MAG TPA: hypothetical protein VFU51_03290 [Gaiellaceae bacterium]|nr:hypothetical protein [Gaiellaceae bacterium]